MNDLQLHHKLLNSNDELKKEVAKLKYRLKKLETEHDKEVTRLKRRNVEWKCKYKKLHNKHSTRDILVTRSAKALKEIALVKQQGFTGTVRSQIRLIAEKHFLSVGHTQDLWYKSNKEGDKL